MNMIGGFLVGFQEPGMTPLICFSAISFLINGFQTIKLVLNKRAISLPDDMKELYLTNFKMMTTQAFLKFYKMSFSETLKKNDQLTIQNQPVENLMLIKSGHVKVIKDEQCVTTMGANFFIGEMSFLSGELATATVVVESDQVEIIGWKKNKLHQLKKDDFDLFDELETAIANNLIKKIQHNL